MVSKTWLDSIRGEIPEKFRGVRSDENRDLKRGIVIVLTSG